MIASYTILPLITGLICERLVYAQMRDDLCRKEQLEEDQAALAYDVRNLLSLLDTDGSGTLNHDEITAALQDDNQERQRQLDLMGTGMTTSDLVHLIDKL